MFFVCMLVCKIYSMISLNRLEQIMKHLLIRQRIFCYCQIMRPQPYRAYRARGTLWPKICDEFTRFSARKAPYSSKILAIGQISPCYRKFAFQNTDFPKNSGLRPDSLKFVFRFRNQNTNYKKSGIMGIWIENTTFLSA